MTAPNRNSNDNNECSKNDMDQRNVVVITNDNNNADEDRERELCFLKSEPRRTTTVGDLKKSRYTMQGRLLHLPAENIRIYQPTYRLTSMHPFNINHINFVIEKCTLTNINDYMPEYSANDAIKFADELSRDIKFRIKLLGYNRYRLIVLVNIVEKHWQTICWKMAFLWDKTADQWTSFQHETKTYIVNVIVLNVYWE